MRSGWLVCRLGLLLIDKNASPPHTHTTQARADPIRAALPLHAGGRGGGIGHDRRCAAGTRARRAIRAVPAVHGVAGTGWYVRSCSWPWAALGREARPALGGTSKCCAVRRYSEHRSLQAGSGSASHDSVADSQSRGRVATATGGTEQDSKARAGAGVPSVDQDPNTRALGSRARYEQLQVAVVMTGLGHDAGTKR